MVRATICHKSRVGVVVSRTPLERNDVSSNPGNGLSFYAVFALLYVPSMRVLGPAHEVGRAATCSGAEGAKQEVPGYRCCSK